MNYYDCPDCKIRTASGRGCGICGRRAQASELEAQKRTEEEFERRMRSIPYQGETLLGALTHAAAMHPTEQNLAALKTYEDELRALERKREREAASQARKSKHAVERILPDDEYEWARDEKGHEYRRKKKQ